ncbi:MAG: hypothetical protein KBT36_03635 [Kurthia sp.]|nr:hypothetical protein [Candidatus Kurthia equi]
MQTLENLYTYKIITKEQHDLIEKAADCLTKTFLGVKVAGKWIQEPIVGELNLPYEDFFEFTKEYIEENAYQGYSAVALDHQQNVVGAMVGDTNAFEITGGNIFEGAFSNMNIVIDALEDIDKRFLEDYKLRYGKEMENGEVLHLFLLGVCAEQNRQEIVRNLGDILVAKAKLDGLRLVLAEATNPKSMRLLQKFQGLEKYIDVEGNHIIHKYCDNEHLQKISPTVADGVYIIVKEI